MGNLESDGLTRRETLKRGLKLTGAALWATPVVQVIGMRPAFATTPSPAGDCDTIYAAKIEILESTDQRCGGVRGVATGIETEYCCEDIRGQDTNPPGQCLTVTPAAVAGPCDEIDAVNFVSGFEWRITLNEGCQYTIGQVSIKAGNELCQTGIVTFDPGTRVLTIRKTAASGSAISHVEFEFCCND